MTYKIFKLNDIKKPKSLSMFKLIISRNLEVKYVRSKKIYDLFFCKLTGKTRTIMYTIVIIFD